MAVLGTELWLTGEGEQIYKEGVEPSQVVEMLPETREALPILYTAGAGDKEIAADTFEAIKDAQLHAAWEEFQTGQ
jgi:hypothetical protein